MTKTEVRRRCRERLIAEMEHKAGMFPFEAEDVTSEMQQVWQEEAWRLARRLRSIYGIDPDEVPAC